MKRSSFILCLLAGSEMKYFKKNTKNNCLAAVLVVLTVAITTTAVLVTTASLSSFPITLNIAIPAAATPTTTGNATNTTSTTITSPASSSSGVELSPQPIYQERSPPGAPVAAAATRTPLKESPLSSSSFLLLQHKKLDWRSTHW